MAAWRAWRWKIATWRRVKLDELTNISALEVLFRNNFGIDALRSLPESDIGHKHTKMGIVEPNEDAVEISSTSLHDHLNE